MKNKKIIAGILFGIFLIFAGCNNDNDNPATSSTSKTFKVTIENVGKEYKFSSSGVFNTPTGESQPGPLLPGSKYEFEFDAAPGSKLSFATMMVHSNDFFYAPDEEGISLFDGIGNPVTGDITSQIFLWDAGTEENQEPGLGNNQPVSQSAANTGAADPNSNIRLATDDFNNLPQVSGVINVTLTNENGTHFKLSIENVSNDNTLTTSDGSSKAIPLAPGVWVVHSNPSPIFTANQMDEGMGLEALAEDGDPSGLNSYLSVNSGLFVPFAPGVWAVHNNSTKIFVSGQADNSAGLEQLAEDGDPSILNSSLTGKSGIASNGVFNTPNGSSSPGPLLPGNSYEFTFEAESGQRLSFATMMVQSNDLFVAPDDSGIDLFDSNNNGISGNITSSLFLWDAGTEVNEKPGIGLNQPLRQSGANTGTTETGIVQKVNDKFSYPSVAEMIKVIIEVQ